MTDEKYIHALMLPAFAQHAIGVLTKIQEGGVLVDSEWEAIEILRDAICAGLATFLSEQAARME